MSKLFATLLAAGFGLGLNSAIAQNTNPQSERNDQSMQQKEPGAGQSQSDTREGVTRNQEGAQSGQNEDTGSARKEKSTSKSQDIPQQSQPSVGHPAEGGQTGQFGERKHDEASKSEGETEATKR